MRIAAIFGGGSREEVEALARHGRILGTPVMLREEFIDLFEVEKLNHRIEEEVLPLPMLYALQDAESGERIKKIMDKRELGREDVGELLDVVLSSKPVAKLRKHMRALVTKANKQTTVVRNKELEALLRRLVASSLEDL